MMNKKLPRPTHKSRNLGPALGVIARALAYESAMHDDVSAWGAPGECHGLVRRGEARRMRLARRHAKAVSGLRYSVMMREARRRIGDKALRRAMDHAEWRIYRCLTPYDR